LNSLGLSSNLGYQIYYIDTDADNTNGNKVITPALTSTIAVGTCPLTCTLEIWD